MNTIGITAYGAANASDSDNDKSTTKAASSSVGMIDFLKLLAAQFQNQDISNPTSNTEFISEMAQFSSLQQMNIVNQNVDRQYCASLVGKTVQVEHKDKDGKAAYVQGVVDTASFGSSGSSVIIKGTSYDSSEVIQIINNAAGTTDTGGTDGGDSKATNDDTAKA